MVRLNKRWRRSQSHSGWYRIYPWGYISVKFKREKSKVSKTGFWYAVLINKVGSGHGYTLGRWETKTKAEKAAKQFMRKR